MRLRAGAIGLSALLVSACWPFAGFVHDERLDGPWRLVAVDVISEMMLCRSVDPFGCVGDGLPGPTVFAAGWDERYIVVAAHENDFHRRETPAHYYIVRVRDDPWEGASIVKGPFLSAEFVREKRRLNLPEFSVVFDELR